MSKRKIVVRLYQNWFSSIFTSGYGSQAVSSSNLTNDDCLSLRSISVDETPDIERKESMNEVDRSVDADTTKAKDPLANLTVKEDAKSHADASYERPSSAGKKCPVPSHAVISHPLLSSSPRSSSDDVSNNQSGESEPHLVNTGLPLGKVSSNLSIKTWIFFEIVKKNHSGFRQRAHLL